MVYCPMVLEQITPEVTLAFAQDNMNVICRRRSVVELDENIGTLDTALGEAPCRWSPLPVIQ